MTLKIKFVLNGIELIDFNILPHNVKDAIIKMLDFEKHIIFNNIILIQYGDEFEEILFMLNKHFDLFITKGE